VDGITRRQALSVAGQAGAAVALGGLGAGCSVFGGGPSLVPTGVRVADLSVVKWTPSAGCTAHTYSGPFGPDQFFDAYLRRDPVGSGVEAVESRCTHLGCPVRYVAEAEKFICPCHGGVFDNSGRPIGGPPKRPLQTIRTVVNHGEVYLVGAPNTCTIQFPTTT
jgi:hypothetical protein